MSDQGVPGFGITMILMKVPLMKKMMMMKINVVASTIRAIVELVALLLILPPDLFRR
jgi:hypothetical protein